MLKTFRQASEVSLTYRESIELILREGGWGSLFGRGLQVCFVSQGLSL